MKNLSELDTQIATLRKQRDAIETRRRTAENRKLLGKCYKFRNSYGVAHEGTWWLYVRVVKADADLRVNKFERTVTNRFEVEVETWGRFASLHEDYIEIPRAEYDAARRKFLADLSKSLR